MRNYHNSENFDRAFVEKFIDVSVFELIRLSDRGIDLVENTFENFRSTKTYYRIPFLAFLIITIYNNIISYIC